MNYFYVFDGVVVRGPEPLPHVWKNTSAFHLQSDEELRKLGWLPEELVGYDITPLPNQIKEEPVLTIQSHKVVSTIVVREKTTTELMVEKVVEEKAVADKAIAYILTFDTPQMEFNFYIHNQTLLNKGEEIITKKDFIIWWEANVT